MFESEDREVATIKGRLKDSLTEEEGLAWANALDSGIYLQGRSDLYNERDDRYCCLGVLGKMMGEIRYEYIPADVENALIFLNDDIRYDFPHIAKLIREAYE